MSEQHLLSYKDLYKIISDAKNNMSNLNVPMYVSGKKLEPGELPTVAVLESILSQLNYYGLLNKAVKLDFS